MYQKQGITRNYKEFCIKNDEFRSPSLTSDKVNKTELFIQKGETVYSKNEKLCIQNEKLCIQNDVTLLPCLTRYRKNDEFSINNARFCIKSVEFCIANDEFVSKNDEFCIKTDEFCIRNGEICTKSAGFAEGMIMGPRTAVSMLIGTILGWCWLGPMAQSEGWAPGTAYQADASTARHVYQSVECIPIESHLLELTGEIGSSDDGAKGWLMWVSLAIMLGESFVSLTILLVRSCFCIVLCCFLIGFMLCLYRFILFLC